ncbi:uncharacterized protein LOC132192384 [Neocloeon triangulifer]|uniref:uncharacterized protein LOC132192384 n=1 Tax=Neocloeon triangulifer TaxID=2078957 RepID=UPI00286EB81C|nr:uncharacterized protein LOC132192384 [Neocloeon triangulifer]
MDQPTAPYEAEDGIITLAPPPYNEAIGSSCQPGVIGWNVPSTSDIGGFGGSSPQPHAYSAVTISRPSTNHNNKDDGFSGFLSQNQPGTASTSLPSVPKRHHLRRSSTSSSDDHVQRGNRTTQASPEVSQCGGICRFFLIVGAIILAWWCYALLMLHLVP